MSEAKATFLDLQNHNGLKARLTNHGARLVALWTPDRHGTLADVVLGFDDLDDYIEHADLYLGCTIGRVANRIANARFTLGGVEYTLACNDGEHHLHGGARRSFDKVIWAAESGGDDAARWVEFSHVSPHLEEGYAGNLRVRVEYSLTDDDELRIEYRCATDAPTPVNLTHHTYWNLAGAGAGSIGDHDLWANASRYTPVGDGMIPTGEIASVRGTPLDFRTAHTIGERIDLLETTPARGYDHNLVLDRSSPGLRLEARLHHQGTGRVMEVLTTEPALQLYSANLLTSVMGKMGHVYRRRGGLCLEAQHFPNAVNQPGFPTVILEPGGEYRQTTVYRFSTD